MAELELVTLHEDAERLVLRGPDGVEHTLAITEALRAAVRRDRPRTEALQAESAATLRPREVQARLRAGATAEDLAAQSGLPLEHVRRYEWPVIAERNHVIAQVRDHHVDSEGKVGLGELADARLAARDVDTDEAVWTARREGSTPWQVEVRFTAGQRERSARWSFDPKGKVVTALDDEARWLGQPDDPVSPEILGVPADPGPRTRPPAPDPAAEATALLLDDLAGRRGQRPAPRPRRTEPGPQAQELPLDLEAGTQNGTTDGAPEDGASIVDLGARRDAQRTSRDTSGAGPGNGADAPEPEEPEPETPVAEVPVEQSEVADPSGSPEPQVEEPAVAAAKQVVSAPPPPAPPAKGRRGSRKGRAQVPSWDEIVFGGARPSP